MGRLIEESRVVEILQQTWLSGTIAHRFIDDIKRRIRIEVPTVDAIPKDQYEQTLRHLKALQNRCVVLTNGTMCKFCSIECEARKEEYWGSKDGNDS